MGGVIPVLNLVCRRSFSRTGLRGVAIDSGTGSRSAPLRIFATETASDEVLATFAVSRSELRREEKRRRDRERFAKRMAEAPPNERLSRELKNRVGNSRPRGFKRAIDSIFSPGGTTLTTRIQNRHVRHLNPSSPIDPNELLQTPQNAHSAVAILEAIGECIATAIRRLELYPQRQDSRAMPDSQIMIPHDQYMWLSSILQFQFSKQQLIRYGASAGLTKAKLRVCRTPDIIALILESVWNLTKEPEPPPNEALVTKGIPALRRI